MEELKDKVNEIGKYLDQVPQQKLFLRMLSEHVLSFAMNSFSFKKEEDKLVFQSSVESVSKIASETIQMLKLEKETSHREDKQGEYLFFKETSKDVMKVQTLIKEIRQMAEQCSMTLHATHYHSFTGILSVKDVCTNKELVHLIGNELLIGRQGQLGNTISQLSSSNAKVRLCFIHGTMGSGKTNFTRSKTDLYSLTHSLFRLGKCTHE
jgi:hypothetical protein